MPSILKLRGATALSDFRLAKCLPQLQAVHAQVRALRAEYWHFVHLDAPLEAQARARLEQLLDDGNATLSPTSQREELFLVVPRLGTLSPWSSKATEIAHQCGLPQVLRIERGVAHYLALDRKSTRLNSSHSQQSRMPSSA